MGGRHRDCEINGASQPIVVAMLRDATWVERVGAEQHEHSRLLIDAVSHSVSLNYSYFVRCATLSSLRRLPC